MKELSRMAYVNIIDKTYDGLKGEEVSLDNIRKMFEREKDFNTLRTFLRIYSWGMFVAQKDEHSKEHISKVMQFRREFYLEDLEVSNPNDPYLLESKNMLELRQKEVEILMNYFESVEDYASCAKLKKNKKTDLAA